MAKRPVQDIEVQPRDLVRALDGISDWVRAVRTAVLKLNPEAVMKVPGRPQPAIESSGIGDGCPPPDPCGDPEPTKPPKYPRPRKYRRRLPRPPK
jgi:hypothetical protein